MKNSVVALPLIGTTATTTIRLEFSECSRSASLPTISGDGSTTCEDTPESILRIPYVWAAVEELARRSAELDGEREVPAQEALRILRACKKASASGTVKGTA